MAKGVIERAEEVVAGRRRAASGELIELVRAVNPTGRELPGKVEAERYRMKSRLQSLLVMRFGAELRVERTADPSVVGLFHAPSGADACHARIDDLEEDARAWVRFQLDAEVGTSPPRAVVPRVPEERRDTASDPLSRGRRALEEYDFEAARRDFEEAMAAGSLEAGVALLEMLVDSLGDFGAAIELEPRLVRPDAHVRTLVALALARTGRRSEARRRVELLDDSRGADVWAALVSGAVADGAIDEAALFASAARAREVRHPELVEAEAALARLVAEKRAPDEERLRAAWDRGDETEAEAIARALGGATAGRILRELDRRRREIEGRRLLDDARALLARGEDAANLARRAAALGISDPEVDAAIALRDTAARERERQERSASIAQRVGHREGLQEFLDADADTRARVRALVDRPLLRWAEAMDSAEAAIALEAGVGLDRYESLLAKLPEGREALRKAREAASERVRVQAEALLAEAITVAGTGDLRGAIERLERIEGGSLSEPSQAKAAGLLKRLRDEHAEARRAERVAGATLAGDRFEALLLAREGGEAWRERADVIAVHVASEWHLSSVDCDIELAAAQIPALEEAAWSSEAVALAPHAGGSLFLPVRAGEWTLVFVVDTDHGRIRRVLRMRAPFGLGFPSCALDAGSLWIIGSDLVLEIDAETFAILGGLRVSAFVPSGDAEHGARLVAGTPWFWIESEVRSSNEIRVRVVDVRQRRVRCEVGDIFSRPVPGTDRVLGTRLGGVSRLYEARGTADSRVQLPAHTQHLCAHPTASGFVALICNEEDGVEIAVLSEDGTVLSRQPIADASPERIAQLAASSDSGLVFACVFTGTDEHDDRELLAWRTRGTALERLWSVPVSRNTSLVSDSRAVRLRLVTGGKGAIAIHTLGVEPPPLSPFLPLPRYFDFPDMEPPFSCRGSNPFSELSTAELVALRGNRAELERLSSKLVDAPADLGRYLARAHRSEHLDIAEELLATAERLHPADGELELARAELALAGGRHVDAIERLRALETRELSVPPRHRAHLLGIAQFLAGDAGEARVTWENARRIAGHCDLGRCLALVSPEGTPVGRIAAAIREADSADDPAERLRILAPHWAADEMQSRVRIAAAWLARDVTDEFDVVRKLAAAAWLPSYKCSRELPLPGAAWSRARILAVTSQALAWLESLTAG